MSDLMGRQYGGDDEFKALARLHQSKYRQSVLHVNCDEYGNRLTEFDAKKLLNYYDNLGVRDALRARYPNYSKLRDADMLRSEHIPFNLFAPLDSDLESAKKIINDAFDVHAIEIKSIKFEFAPEPKGIYLDDGTAFDTVVFYTTAKGEKGALGIEVKYTEKDYRIGNKEKINVENSESRYWTLSRSSNMFKEDSMPLLSNDSSRQIWRNHLLGLSMIQNGDIAEFYSVTVFPNNNSHFHRAISQYQTLLQDSCKNAVFGCTFEKYISSIAGDGKIDDWKRFLENRYIVKNI